MSEPHSETPAAGPAPAAAASSLLARLRRLGGRAGVGAVLLAVGAAALFFVAQPRIGVTDAEGYADIMGARALRAGLGLHGLVGDAFNPWPPGYALILSLFSDQLVGAWIVGGVSLGAAVGLLYFLARRASWTWQAALGVSVGLGAGFLRIVASTAHADILAYAVFLAALVVAAVQPGRIAPALVWALLAPVKLVALAFLPSAALADLAAAPGTFPRLALRYILPALITAAAAGLLFAGNPAALAGAAPSPAAVGSGVVHFAASIPRQFLFAWYGPMAGLWPKLALGASLVLVAVCAVAMKPLAPGRWLRLYGAAFLICCAVLLALRAAGPAARVSGYGLIALVVGFQPLRWANWPWLAWGALSLAVAGADLATHNDLGANDPRYARLAAEVGGYDRSGDTIASNAFHILDLGANLPSQPIAGYAEAAPYRELLWVTLPSYDAAASIVTPLPAPGAGWTQVQAFDGGVLYRRSPAP